MQFIFSCSYLQKTGKSFFWAKRHWLARCQKQCQACVNTAESYALHGIFYSSLYLSEWFGEWESMVWGYSKILRSVWQFGKRAEMSSDHCYCKRSVVCEPRDFCLVKLKAKLLEPLKGTLKIASEKSTNQNHCLPICTTFTLCHDIFLSLYGRNALKAQSGFLSLWKMPLSV